MRKSRIAAIVSTHSNRHLLSHFGNSPCTGSKEIDPTAKPDKRTKNLEKGVAKMLKNYPPKQK
jgi:hypothetical protein